MEITILGNLDYSHARVLLMVGAQPAVERASVTNLGCKFERNPAGTIKPRGVHVHFSVGAYDSLEPPVFGTALLHVDPPVSDMDLSVQDLVAFGADAPRQLNENRVAFDCPTGF